MTDFKQTFSKINGVSDRRRLPRLGKIRLGVKAVSKKGTEYPKEVDYFVCPPEVQKVYGEKPKVLDVMFPINDIEVVFPQAYKYYGSQKGLKCIGNGTIAKYYSDDNSGITEKACPCDLLVQKKCSKKGNLMVILPKVSLGGVYQIDTGSGNSITDINSGIDYTRAIIMQTLNIDRFAFVPCLLERVQMETHHDGQKQIHYTLRITPNITLEQLQLMRNDTKLIAPPQMALPPVEDVNPEQDPGAIVVTDQEEPDTAQAEEPPTESAGSTTEQLKLPENKLQIIILRWKDICEAQGIPEANLQEMLRHSWLEATYKTPSLKELDEKQLLGLFNVLTGKHKDSESKIQAINQWIMVNVNNPEFWPQEPEGTEQHNR